MENLYVRSKKLYDCVDDDNKKIRMLEKNIEEKYGQEAMKETGLPVLKQGLKETKKEAEEMKTEVQRTKTEVSAQMAHLRESIQNQIAEMQNQLNDKESSFLKMKGDLHIGQTAYDFENYLCTHIYPPGTFVTHDQKFTALMKWLKDNKDTPEGREGNRKWERLTDKYGWTDATHKPVFLEMIRCRLPHAHPMVDFSLPIPENFNTYQKEKCVEDIRNMTVELFRLVVEECNLQD